MKDIQIKNRTGETVCVDIDLQERPVGLAFVLHGLGGFKEQPHIQTFVKALWDNGYSVVSFDATSSIGKSDGAYEDVMPSGYIHDLEDVIAWASEQEWYQEPFVLFGHSMGGLAVCEYAIVHPDKVKALAPISTVVSGEFILEAPGFAPHIDSWNETGVLIQESHSKPGVVKKLPWKFMEEMLTFDLRREASKLTMPVLLAVGDQDDGTPSEQQQAFLGLLPGKKELHLIDGAGHNFRGESQRAQLYDVISHWLTLLNKKV